MATQQQNKEQFADLITCSVCLDEFNQKQRAPKFLPCSHTICLDCLKSIAGNGRVSCPLCRNVVECPDGVHKLPNNSWALHMVETKNHPTVIRWCWSCRSSAEQACLESHPTFSIDNSRLEEVHKLQRAASLHASRLDRAKERGKILEKYYSKLLSTLKSVVKDVEQQMATHNLHLAHLASLADEYYRIVGMIDSFQSIKEDLERSIEDSEQEMELSRRIWWEHQNRLKIKIAVRLSDEQNRKLSTPAVMEQGFSQGLLPYNRELELLTYCVFSYLKQQNAKPLPVEGVAVQQSRSPSTTMSEVKTKFKKMLSSGSKMLLHNTPLNSKSTPPGGGQQLSASQRWRREQLPQNSSRPRSLGNIHDPDAKLAVPSTSTPPVGGQRNQPEVNTSHPPGPPPVPPRINHELGPSGDNNQQLPQLPTRTRQRPDHVPFSAPTTARTIHPPVADPPTGFQVVNAIYRPPVDNTRGWSSAPPVADSVNDASLGANQDSSLTSLDSVPEGSEPSSGVLVNYDSFTSTSVPSTPGFGGLNFFYDLQCLPPPSKPPPPPKPRTVFPSNSSNELQEVYTMPI